MFQPGGPTFLELARQALSSTRRGYDLLAPKFDLTPFRTPAEILGRAAAVLAPARRVLDICCGTGAGIAALQPVTTERLVGLDFSEGMLVGAARRSLPGAAPASLIQGDALAMPFGESFDLATCFGALGHFVDADEDALIAEVARVLRPGGRFAFVTSDMPPVGSLRWLFARGFNAAMHVRNALVRPPFVMCYLTFALPDVLATLARHGLTPEVTDPGFPQPFRHARLVIARKQAEDGTPAAAPGGDCRVSPSLVGQSSPFNCKARLITVRRS